MADRCLVCNGALVETLAPVFDTRFGAPESYAIARCSQCGLEQTTPRPSGPALGALYARYYNFGGERGTRYTALREKFLNSALYRIFLTLDGDISFHARPGTGRLLDIGCNEGRGLALYARNGFDAVEGLETNPVAAASARSRGFAIHEVDLSAFQPAELFDVAVLSNVLEHALDPTEMLRHVARILKPGGQVWISCPNARSWARCLFGARWINWHVPFHIVHFTEETLLATVDRAEFRAVESDQITPALWIAHSVLSRCFAKPGEPTMALRKPLWVMALMGVARGVFFPVLWLGNRLGRGDCLRVVAEVSGRAG